MKKTWIYLLTMLAISTAAVSCSDDDDNKSDTSSANGRPSTIISGYGNKLVSHSFYYDNKKLVRLQENNDSAKEFTYDRKELVKVSSVTVGSTDGIGTTVFTKSGSKITAKHQAEPFFDIIIDEIELDGSGRAVKITSLGRYKYDINGQLEKLEDGNGYSVLSYDSSTGSVLKQDRYDNNGTWRDSYTFRYDRKPGMTSTIDMPMWYRAYAALPISNDWGYFANTILLNYAGNLSSVSYEGSAAGESSSDYSYDYNPEGYPVKATNADGSANISY